MVEIEVPRQRRPLKARLPLMGSGEEDLKECIMTKADAFRTTATWLAAMFVGTMFVAASTSFAGLA
jgi:hypothetical protein